MRKIFFTFLFISMISVSAQELMMVWSKKVDLYNEQGKVVKLLHNGQLVSVEAYAKDATRFSIEIDGVKYNASKKYFKKPADIVTIYKKSILDYEAEIKKNDLRLSNIESDLIVRYTEALEYRRDTALAYEKITSGLVNGTNTSFRGFVLMLSEGKYKKLIKAWSKEVVKLEAEKKEIQTLKRKYYIAMEKLKYKIAEFENLGEMVASKKNQGNYYLVISDNAQLYQNNKVVKNIAKGTSVLGRAHPKFSGWFEVIHEDKKYVISSKSLVKKSDFSKVLKEKMITARVLINQLNKEVELQQFRLKLYQGVSRQLEADKFVAGGYGIVKNLIVPIDKDRTFTIKSPTADRVFVNATKANKVLAEWKIQSQELAQASIKNQKTVLALKKQLIDLQNDLNNFQ